jgi:glycosyltransferase involved in cell wall biosynthesis
MNILFVHEVSWFKKVVFEMHDFPELLSLRGHEVRFLDFDEGVPRTKLRTLSAVESRSHAGSHVVVTTPPRFLPGILGRLLATVIQPLTFLRLIHQKTPDVVVSYSVPTSGWQIALIARICRIPVVARVIDVPHALRPISFRTLVKAAERLVFRLSSFVVTHNEVLHKYCIDLGARPERCAIVYPGVDTKRFFPNAPDPGLQKSYGIEPTDKVMIFMGTLFSFGGVAELLEELTPKLRADSQLKFLVLGGGEQFALLQQRTSNLHLEKQVILTGQIEYESLAEHLRLGHVAMLPFRANLVTHGALPNKVLQYLACGLPTVCTPLQGLQSMLSDGHGVIYAENFERMVALALDLLENSERRAVVSISGLTAIQRCCDWDIQIERFENVLKSVLRG